MITRQTQIRLGNIIMLTTAALAILVMAGCQGDQRYSKLEEQVFGYFEPISHEVPKGMTPGRDESKGVYSYHDGGSGPAGGRTSRFIRYQVGQGLEELWLGHTPRPKKKESSFLGFYSRSGDTPFVEGPQDEQAQYVVDELFMLQDETDVVVYFKKKGGLDWGRCELGGVSAFTLLAHQRAGCLGQAENVPTEQVQRYIDLADRVGKVYFFRK